MKLNRIITLCAVAASLALGLGSALAQQDNGGDNNGQRRQRGGFGGGNIDPAQMQQRFLDNIRDRLSFTNDADWNAVQPMVQKVLDARRDLGNGMRGMFGGRNRGGDQGGQGGNRPSFFGQPSPEQEALQKALDDDAPTGQIKDLLAKYKASQAAKQAKLEAAQDALKGVLTPKQEAQAYLMQLVR